MNDLATAGGLLFFLTFFHFIFDWVPQTHADATAKSKDWWIRAVHVTVYTTLMMIPIGFILGHHLDGGLFYESKWFWYALISFGVTWVTHFIGDTYIPVGLWAKYIRKIPEFQDLTNPNPMKEMSAPEAAVAIILVIVMDQLWHITFLTVPVALAVWG